MEEYLTVKELSDKIKFSRQSLYNLIHKGTFVLGKHYLKPTPKKILFKWTEIREWMGESLHSQQTHVTKNVSFESSSVSSDGSAIKKPTNLINI
jgi:predicted DNA-binding transcriptional regulator AlpA